MFSGGKNVRTVTRPSAFFLSTILI